MRDTARLEKINRRILIGWGLLVPPALLGMWMLDKADELDAVRRRSGANIMALTCTIGVTGFLVMTCGSLAWALGVTALIMKVLS